MKVTRLMLIIETIRPVVVIMTIGDIILCEGNTSDVDDSRFCSSLDCSGLKQHVVE